MVCFAVQRFIGLRQSKCVAGGTGNLELANNNFCQRFHLFNLLIRDASRPLVNRAQRAQSQVWPNN